MRNLKFWGKEGLQEMGMILGIAILLLLFAGWKGSEWMGNGLAGKAEMALSLYPWYLMIVGALVLFMSIIGCFMVYLPALIAVNCTRRSAFLGMMLMHLGLMGSITVLSGIIWTVLKNDVAVSGRELVIPSFGCLLLVDAIGGSLGILVQRWGKAGIGAAIGALFGGGLGIGFYEGYSGGITELFERIAGTMADQRILFYGFSLGIGAGAFCLMAVFEALTIRKMEARL